MKHICTGGIYGRQNNDPQRCPNLWNLRICYTTWQGGMQMGLRLLTG